MLDLLLIKRGARWCGFLCVAVCFAALASGCGIAADGPLPSSSSSALTGTGESLDGPIDPAKVSGDVVLFTGSSPLEAEIMRGLIDDFEQEYPKINVKFTAINRDYPTVVLTRFAGGEVPDVFTVDGKFMADWSAKGLLLPLDEYLEEDQVDLSRYRPNLLDSTRGPGNKIFALPVNYSTVSLYVNDRMFEEAGVTAPPTTWDELEDVAARTTENAGLADGHYGLCLVPRWERVLLFALQQDGGLTSPDGTSMIVKDKTTRRAIDWVQRMLSSGTTASPDKMGSSWCGEAFGRGKAAMALEGAWMVPPMRNQYPKVSYSVHPLPVGARAATLAYSGNIAIARTSKNPKAAWLLLDYLASPYGQAQLANAGVGVPAMRGVPFPAELKGFAGGLRDATVWSLPPGFFNSVLITADNEMSAVLEGKQTVEGMLDEIEKSGNLMLTRRRR